MAKTHVLVQHPPPPDAIDAARRVEQRMEAGMDQRGGSGRGGAASSTGVRRLLARYGERAARGRYRPGSGPAVAIRVGWLKTDRYSPTRRLKARPKQAALTVVWSA